MRAVYLRFFEGHGVEDLMRALGKRERSAYGLVSVGLRLIRGEVGVARLETDKKVTRNIVERNWV